MTESVAPEQQNNTPSTDNTSQPRNRRAPQGNNRGGANNKGNKGGGQAPRARKVHPALEKLFTLYPQIFGARFLPLKRGTFQDLMAAHPEMFEKDELKVALGLHTRSTRYLECVAAGHQRHDLQGVPVEDMAPEHVHHAILEVFKRRQGRTADDLRPYVYQQLITAFEASGLGREAYAELVRTQNEDANALLDGAFAELGSRQARNEALLRAFEASGSTVEQFADMYGMAVEAATEALEKARAQRVLAAAV